MFNIKRTDKKRYAFFSCADCAFNVDGWIHAEDKAQEHAKKTGHRVAGELTLNVTFEKDGSEK